MSFAQGAPTQPLVLQGSNVFLYGSSTSGNAFTVQQQSVGNVVSFQTSTNATAFIINPSGYVGIGKTNPAYALDVTGDLNFTGTFRQNGTPYIGSQWTGTSTLYFVGNVGINTTSVANPLTVNGTIVATTFSGSAASLTSFPTLNQNTTGTAAGLSATLALSSGGTGQTTAQSAMNALAGAQTNAQYLRGNGTNVVMSAIQASDVPTLNQNTTGSAASLSGNPSTSVSPLYILGTTATPSWDALSDASQRTNTYIAFNEAGSGSDWAYLRQIGGNNGYEMAFDFHDDGDDCRMSWRDVQSTAAPDNVNTRMRLYGGALFVSGDITAFNNFSDARLKEDVVNIEDCLDKVQELRPVEFTWKQDIRNNTKRGKRDVGLIAQEAFKVFPLAHNIIQDPDTNEDIHTLKYERFVPLLIGALKEEKAKRESLELRLERVEKLLLS